MRSLLLLSLSSSLLLASSLTEFLVNKPALSEKSVAEKKEGIYFTGLPLLNSDPDKGIGYGARIYMYDNGSKEDETFKYTPYDDQLFLQVFQSTNGWNYNWLYWDSNYVAKLPLRLTSSLVLESNSQATYYGHTAAVSMGKLSDTLNNTYTTTAEQTAALKTQNSPYYNRYGFYNPKFELNAQYSIFGGLVRVGTGIKLSHVTIKDYAGAKAATFTELSSDNNLTLLDPSATGFAGGFNNGLKLGIIYDSRDFAPNPTTGSAHDFTAEFFTPWLGSTYTYQRYTVSSKNFYTPTFYEAITFAGQFLYSAIRGDAPFYDYSAIGYTDNTNNGLGGLRTLRGYTQDRFVGPVKTLLNVEARWTAWDFGGGNKFLLVPFVDAGAAFDAILKTDYTQLKYTKGVGVRYVWNQSTIIMFDYGVSDEDSSLYINFSNIF